jgi:chemotaxis-related protein WspB
MLLLTLKAGSNRYGIDVARVIELIPYVELTIVPHSSSFLAGLLSLRGKVIPVIDLGLLLSSTPCRECLSTRIILVDVTPGDRDSRSDATTCSNTTSPNSPQGRARDARLLGLIGEQVSDLTHVDPDQVAPTPVQLHHMPFLDAIVQTKDGIMQLIAVDRIRDATLSHYVLNQGTPPGHHPSKAGAAMQARDASSAND